MNTQIKLLAALLLLSAISHQLSTALAQGTAFTYQGRLNDNGSSASGTYDLRFAVYTAAVAGTQTGGPLTNSAVGVSNGLFTATLDFGGVFTGADRWLEIAVRTNGGGAFATLTPRQPISPTPYAIFAGNAQLLNGQGTNGFAPAAGSPSYVAKSGDTMTGTLNLPANGLVAGGSQFVLSGGSVGIGTTSPNLSGDTRALTVSAGTSGEGIARLEVQGTRIGDNIYGALDFYHKTNNTASIESYRSGADDAGNLTFWTKATGTALKERMRIDNSGNLGIGTATPATSLEVVGNGPNSPIAIFKQSNLANLGRLVIDSPTDDASRPSLITLRRAGIDRWSVGGIYGSDSFGIGSDSLLTSQKFVVTPSGNVGIGTTTPASKLHLRDGTIPTTLGASAVLTIAGADTGSGPNVKKEIQFKTWGNAATAHGIIGIETVDTAAFEAGDLYFATKTGTANVPPTEKMRIANNGNVGIGTTAPSEGKLVVVRSDSSTSVADQSPGVLSIRNSDLTSGNFSLITFNDGQALTATAGIGTWNTTHAFSSATAVGDLALFTKASGASVLSERMRILSSGNVGIGTTNPTAKLEVNGAVKVTGTVTVTNGHVATPVLLITGGADVAEPFQISTADIPKGSVVVIDEDNPGRLKLSDLPYDKRVAGIVSGANGVNSGITLSQQGVLEGGQNVALSGRVYVQADATHGAIKPGDLLTTSPVPGHAMKVTDHAQAQGAILGKAMTPLKEGKGMVLVLVTLQ